MIQAFALIACLCVANDDVGEHLELIKNLGNLYDIVKVAELEPKIDKALASNKIKNIQILKYFKSAKKDIKTLNNLDKNKLEKVKELIANITEAEDEFAVKVLDNVKINKTNSETKELIAIFGETSFVDLHMTEAMIYFNLRNKKNQDHIKLIEYNLERFQKSDWKDSIFLERFYLSLSENYLNEKNYLKAYDCSTKSLEMRKILCNNLNDPILLSPLVFKLESLKGQNKNQEIITEFKKIPLELLDNNERIRQYHLSKIYSSLASAYNETNCLNSSIDYQELALSKMYTVTLDRNHTWVQEQANILQTYLAKKGDWAAVRTLEERYELKPLPKDAKEK